MASIIKVDNVQNTPGTNIVSKCGTTITLGASSDTVALASGASQTGFGRTGTVDWVTTPKTATFTAVNGEGYFCNTAASAFTMNLPAGSAGAIVSLQDYNNTFDTYALTVQPNGSEKINSGVGKIELSVEGEGLTLVYVDSTVGWRSIHQSTFTTAGTNLQYIVASATGCTGPGAGCVVDTNYKVHTFNGPGTFTVTCAGNPYGSNTVSYVVVGGGGGGGGGDNSGGGGAGGFRESKAASDSYTASPLNATSGANYNLPVSATPYPISVGGSGAGNPGTGTSGCASSFSTITSAGGGGGGSGGTGTGLAGGSGGGGGYNGNGAVGNTPPTSPPQGNGGASQMVGGPAYGGGGGGGATVAGSAGSPGAGGAGGAGASTEITGAAVTRAGGGGAGAEGGPQAGAGGAGGGGAGAGNSSTGGSAVINTGGGGGGTGGPASGGNGGGGVVIIRYRFQ